MLIATQKIYCAFLSLIIATYLGALSFALTAPYIPNLFPEARKADIGLYEMLLIVLICIVGLALLVSLYYSFLKRIEYINQGDILKISYTKSLLWLAVFCAGLSIFKFYNPNEFASSTAFLVGYNSLYALIAWILYTIVAGASLSKGTKAVSLVCIITLLVAIDVRAIEKRTSYENFVYRVQDHITQYIQLQFSGSNDPQLIELESEVAEGLDPYSIMEKWLVEYLNSNLTLQAEHTQEMQNIGWTEILNPERIKNDISLEESRNIFRNARLIAIQFEEKHKEQRDRVLNSILNLSVPNELKQGMLDAFTQNTPVMKELIAQTWKYEIEIINEHEKLVTLLNQNDSEWEVEQPSGAIQFSNAETMNLYSGIIDTLQQKLRMQQQQLARSQATATQHLELLIPNIANPSENFSI